MYIHVCTSRRPIKECANLTCVLLIVNAYLRLKYNYYVKLINKHNLSLLVVECVQNTTTLTRYGQLVLKRVRLYIMASCLVPCHKSHYPTKPRSKKLKIALLASGKWLRQATNCCHQQFVEHHISFFFCLHYLHSFLLSGKYSVCAAPAQSIRSGKHALMRSLGSWTQLTSCKKGLLQVNFITLNSGGSRIFRRGFQKVMTCAEHVTFVNSHEFYDT